MAAELLTNATRTTLASYQLMSTPRPASHVVFFLHGFTQNSLCWGPFPELIAHHLDSRYSTKRRDELVPSFLFVGLDCPGHGESHRHGTATLDESAMLIHQTITHVLTELHHHLMTDPQVILLGYSMGGRLALHTALHAPEVPSALITMSATQGNTHPDKQLERRHEDRNRADYLLEVGLEVFLDEWLALDLFAKIPPERAYRAERLTNDAAGLARSLVFQGTGNMVPNLARLAVLDCPTLLISGADDTKFVAAALELQTSIGNNAVHVSLPDAGHSPHLEQPENTAVVVGDFLAQLAGSAQDISA